MEALLALAAVLQPIGVIAGCIGAILGLPYGIWKAKAFFVRLLGVAEEASRQATAAAESSKTAAADAAVAKKSSADTGTSVDQLSEQLAGANRTIGELRDRLDSAYAQVFEAKADARIDQQLIAWLRSATEVLAAVETHLATVTKTRDRKDP